MNLNSKSWPETRDIFKGTEIWAPATGQGHLHDEQDSQSLLHPMQPTLDRRQDASCV